MCSREWHYWHWCFLHLALACVLGDPNTSGQPRHIAIYTCWAVQLTTCARVLQLRLEGHRHSYFTSVCYQAMTRTIKFVPFVTHRLAKELIYINRLFQLLRLDLLDCFTFTPTTYISWLFEHWCPTTMATTAFFIDDVLVGGISGSARISGHTTNDMWSNVFHTTWDQV